MKRRYNKRYSHSRYKRNKRRTFNKKKPSKIKRLNWFTRKHPIATGVILIILSLIIFRLSFTNAFLSSAEVVVWTWILAGGLFLAGLLILIGWWRNNISMLTTKHNVTWKTH